MNDIDEQIEIDKQMEIIKREREMARINSIDEVIERLKSLTPHNLVFASKPSKNYSIRMLFENPDRTEFLVRNEQSNEKIKELLNTIYKRFFVPDELGFSNTSMGREYIANIVYPLVLQGRLQETPREYVHDAILYLETKCVETQHKGDEAARFFNANSWDSSNAPRYRREVESIYDCLRSYQEKADLIKREYEVHYLLPKVSAAKVKA